MLFLMNVNVNNKAKAWRHDLLGLAKGSRASSDIHIELKEVFSGSEGLPRTDEGAAVCKPKLRRCSHTTEWVFKARREWMKCI